MRRRRARGQSHAGRPRILLLIKCLGYGGAEQLLVEMMAKRDRQAFDYEVAYVLSSYNALVPAMESTGVVVHDLGARGNGDPRWLPALRRLLVERRYDLVHLHLPYSAALGRLVVLSMPRDRRPLLVYTEHSQWAKTAPLLRGISRVAVGRDRALIAVSRSAGDALPAGMRRRATIVVHGIDQSRIAEVRSRRRSLRSEVRAELAVPEGELLALTVANLRTEKGYDVLLDAARRVIDAGTAVRFAAAGRGPKDEAMRARHRELRLGERFRFLGPRSDVLRLMAGADIFVLASRYEGLPVALMEATSMGMAIVATAVGEIPNFLSDAVDALLVPPGQAGALADAVVRLAKDEGLRCRLGDAARSHASEFDITRAVTEVEAIYGRLLHRVG